LKSQGTAVEDEEQYEEQEVRSVNAMFSELTNLFTKDDFEGEDA